MFESPIPAFQFLSRRAIAGRDLLVLHPVESVWAVKITRDAAPTWEVDHPFLALSSALLGANLDFDYGSEDVMSRHARVKGGKLVVAKAEKGAIVPVEVRTYQLPRSSGRLR